MMPGHFTPEQCLLPHYATVTTNHLQATAGSGKTTMLVEAAWHLQLPSVSFADNKRAVVDLQLRLPRHCRARTLHRRGWKCLKDVNPRLTLDTGKSVSMAAEIFPGNHQLARAWSIARKRWWPDLDEAQAQFLADRVEWNLTTTLPRDLIRTMHRRDDELWLAEDQADDTDFLWLAVRLKIAEKSLALTLLHEAQDAAMLRQQFVRHLLVITPLTPDQENDERLIFVGDPDQPGYKWSDALPDAGFRQTITECQPVGWPSNLPHPAADLIAI